MDDMQTSLVSSVSCEGVGVHSGKIAHVNLRPAEAGTGFRFVRTDLADGIDPVIQADIGTVNHTRLRTSIRNADGAEVATIEHLLAACMGIGLDNVAIEIDGPEVPILDGSALPYVQMIKRAGLQRLAAPRRRLRILEPVSVRQGDSEASLSPADGDRFSLDVTIEFPNTLIGRSRKALTLVGDAFQTELAPARTFSFAHDLRISRKMGLTLGGSLDNAIVVDGMRIANPDPLRFEDEFVRHKMLDAVGDLALAGAPIAGQFKATRPGHGINTTLVRRLMETPTAWRLEKTAALMRA